MGRTTTLTSRSFQPKLYPQRSLQPGDESSPRPESRAAGATGPHRGRFYKIVPSSPTSADSASDDSCGDVSRHKGSFMAEVCPAGKDKGGISLARMVSVRLHVVEERPASGAGQVTTSNNFKRWVSTDALNTHSNNNYSTNTSAVESTQHIMSSDVVTPNGFLPIHKEGKINEHSTQTVSESGSVLHRETGKRHAKKRWKIKRIFGIKT